MFIVRLAFIGFLGSFYFAQAERCYHCTGTTDPSTCTITETCGPDQICSIRQYVTTEGSVLYSTGCLNKTRCRALGNTLGKREISKRGTDVTICYECCDGEFCNNQGCGVKAQPAQGERCFHCTGITDPSNCTKVEACGPDQVCSTRQFVTPDGRLLYSSGCLDKTKCGSLGSIIGKRDISERGTDVTTCYQCCDHEFCNNQGCGTKAVSRDQRGPYCFTCDVNLDPKACTHINICKETEECIVFVSPELSSPSQLVYTSMCESKAACAAFTHISTNSSCPPVCCNQDFCNDQCNHGGPATSPPASVLKASTHFQCNTSAGYQLLQDITGSTSLCIQINTNNEDWDNARATCTAAGGDLVVLDTRDKAVLLRNTIQNDQQYNHQTGYWIGARDFDLANNFVWVNNRTADISEGDWFPGQPNHYDGHHDQNCAVMWRGVSSPPQDYKWHDDYCPKPLGFICQQS